MTSFRVLVFAVLQAPLRTASEQCFEDAIRPHLRQGMSQRHGILQKPLGLWIGDWPSCQLVSAIFRILVEEVLGYNVTYGFGITTWQGLRAVAGCSDPLDATSDCKAGQASRYHVALEIWDAIQYPFGDPNEKPFLLNLGSIGYPGQWGMSVLERHLFREGRWYDFYRSFDVRLKPWVDFQKMIDFPASSVMSCNRTRFYNHDFIEEYLRLSGDSDGVVMGAGGTVAKCWNGLGQIEQSGSWWLAPSCRLSPQHCIPLIACGDGYSAEEYMQKAAAHSMPLAISVASDCNEWMDAWVNRTILFAWYTPQASVHRPLYVMFPLHDEFAWTIDDKSSHSSSKQLDKYATTSFHWMADKVFFLLERFHVNYQTLVEDLFVPYPMTLPTSGSASAFRFNAAALVACNWLKSNPSIWNSWVPQPTDCAHGQGLVDSNGFFLENASMGVACEQCAPGTVSFLDARQTDGRLIFTCKPCPVGTFNPAAGIRNNGEVVRCPICPRGRYSAIEGARICSPCAVGRYQNESGKTSCSVCPGGTYSPLVAEFRCTDCPRGSFRPEGDNGRNFCEICPPNSYQDMRGQTGCIHCKVGFATTTNGARGQFQCICPNGWYYHAALDQCEACPAIRGISCPGGHSQVNNTPDETVMIDPSYMTLPNALNTYLCKHKARCIGQRSPFTGVPSPPMCAGGFVAPGCSQCPEQRYVSGTRMDECISCDTVFVPVQVLGAFLYLCVLNACAGFYYTTMFPPSPMGTAYGPIISLCQSLSVALEMNFRLPKDAEKLVSYFSFLMGDLASFGFPRGCLWGSSPVWLYASNVLWPCGLLVGFLILYCAGNAIPALICRILKHDVVSPAQFIPKKGICRRIFDYSERISKKSVSQIPVSTRMSWFWRIKLDNIFNCILKTFNALYISLAKCGLVIFMFVEHPGGAITLVKEPDVDRFSSEWWAMFPTSMVALVLYCLSFFAYVIYVVSIAPRRFPIDPHFRVRHRGLWAKYTPEAWWFCIANLTYALSLNVAAVVFITGREQILSSIIVSIFYIWFVTLTKPFHFVLNYQADLLCKSGYLFFMVFASTTLDDRPIQEDVAQVCMLAACIAPIVFCIVLVGKFLWYREIAARTALGKRVDFAYRLMDVVEIIGNMDRLQIRAFSFQLLENDVQIVDDALDVMAYMLLGLQPPRSWKRYCGTHPFQQTVPGRLEGELWKRHLPGGTMRQLFREFRESLLQVDRHASMRAFRMGDLRGFNNAETLHHITNLFYHGSLTDVHEFSLTQFKVRVSEIFSENGTCPFSEAQLDTLFTGLALEDRCQKDNERTVNRNEFFIQMSHHAEPVAVDFIKPDVTHEIHAEPVTPDFTKPDVHETTQILHHGEPAAPDSFKPNVLEEAAVEEDRARSIPQAPRMKSPELAAASRQCQKTSDILEAHKTAIQIDAADGLVYV